MGQQKDLGNDEAQRKRLGVVKEKWQNERSEVDGSPRSDGPAREREGAKARS